jgi:hypothetical protein
MARLLVGVTSLCLAATLTLVALASTETRRPQGVGSATPQPVDLRSAPSARLSPSASPAPTPAATPAPTKASVPDAPEVRPQAVTKSLSIIYQAQTTSYWCAPAAARIALSSKVKKLPTQAALATELGTTAGGTDSILEVVDGLNRLLAGTGTQYVTRDWSNHPMTPAMTQQLWSDTVRDVDDGKAMVANIVAAPDNRPHHYPAGQTFYHYVTIVGYNSANQTVHVSDPGRFNGIEDYWLSLNQMASLIQPKGYAA